MNKQVDRNALRNAADMHRNLVVEVGPDVRIEDLLTPGFWDPVSYELRAAGKWAKVDVISTTGTWEAQLRVVGAKQRHESGGAHAVQDVELRLLSSWHAPELEMLLPIPEGYEIHHVPGIGWSVIWAHPRHGKSLATGIPFEAEARKVAHEHRRERIQIHGE